MKNKAILLSLIVFFALVFTLAPVKASIASIDMVKVNGMVANGHNAGDVSDSVPVEVYFFGGTSSSIDDNSTVDDVKVKVYIEGYKEDISQTSDLFYVTSGGYYVKRFTLKLPPSRDLDVDPEDVTLNVRISAKGEDPVEQHYNLIVQKTIYGITILSIDSPDTITPGSTIPVDVVIENQGHERLDDLYITASIPELGVTRRVYASDLSQNKQDSYDNIRNSVEKIVYLSIPANAAPGNYNIKVEASNYDTTASEQKKIVVESLGSQVVPTTTSQTIAIGQETTFNIVLVNPNNKLVIYTLTPEQVNGFSVSIDQPVVPVAAGGSQTVKVTVKALDSAQEGTHSIVINVNSDIGVTKQVTLSANVEKATSNTSTTTITSSNTVLILTVVLSIIFVVLLVVLIVLLTRKPAESEELGETSYY